MATSTIQNANEDKIIVVLTQKYNQEQILSSHGRQTKPGFVLPF